MPRIVLIDDHKIITDGISSLLAGEKEIEIVECFHEPQQALDFLDTHRVDIVLTDLDMPKLKGEDVLMYCKSKFPSTKVVVLSMHNEKAIIKHLIGLGADGYLLKSADKSEIISALETVNNGAKYFSNEVMQALITENIEEDNQNPALDILSEREVEIIRLIAEGFSSKEIGTKLFISHRTVETHRNNILKKLDVNGIAGLIRFAFKHNLIS